MDFDVIVIGSGFGGAITACRLAEGNYRALILERGRRWDKTNYPRRPTDPWIWSHEHPETKNGWLDLRVFPNMTVAAGAAVGGGSLIYANISAVPPKNTFDAGWPREISFAELEPHYAEVGRFMRVQQVPDNQWSARMKLVRDAAVATGNSARFRKLDLAVSFDPNFTYEQDDPHNVSKSVPFVNAQGVEQGTCVHLGNCDIGCDADAKNTLDRNYIPWAEKHGAEVRPLHLATNVEPLSGGYRVSYDRLDSGRRISGSATARIVIVAAGSLGSTELLLRCREETQSLPNLSPFLGHNWSSNGDFLTPALHEGRAVSPTRGPTIACAIDFLDRSFQGESFWIQDGGFPDLAGDYLRGHAGDPPENARARLLLESIRHLLGANDPFRHIMPWFAQSVDAGDGLFSLKKKFWLFGPRRLHLAWDIARSKATINAVVDMHKKLAEATGGIPLVPPTWWLAHDLVTPHPLGGCNMGDSPQTGVVDHRGEVFGYRNLYVADAAIIPEAIGVNPSRTVGALAERIAAIIKAEGR